MTSLAYLLTPETPLMFATSRDVGPYLGLVPAQEDSGDSQPQLGISKAGDRMLRKLLIVATQPTTSSDRSGRTAICDDLE